MLKWIYVHICISIPICTSIWTVSFCPIDHCPVSFPDNSDNPSICCTATVILGQYTECSRQPTVSEDTGYYKTSFIHLQSLFNPFNVDPPSGLEPLDYISVGIECAMRQLLLGVGIVGELLSTRWVAYVMRCGRTWNFGFPASYLGRVGKPVVMVL